MAAVLVCRDLTQCLPIGAIQACQVVVIANDAGIHFLVFFIISIENASFRFFRDGFIIAMKGEKVKKLILFLKWLQNYFCKFFRTLDKKEEKVVKYLRIEYRVERKEYRMTNHERAGIPG